MTGDAQLRPRLGIPLVSHYAMGVVAVRVLRRRPAEEGLRVGRTQNSSPLDYNPYKRVRTLPPRDEKPSMRFLVRFLQLQRSLGHR